MALAYANKPPTVSRRKAAVLASRMASATFVAIQLGMVPVSKPLAGSMTSAYTSSRSSSATSASVS